MAGAGGIAGFVLGGIGSIATSLLGIGEVNRKEQAEGRKIRNEELDEDRRFNGFKDQVTSNLNVLREQYNLRLGGAIASEGASGSMVGFGSNMEAIAQQRQMYTEAIRPAIGGMERGQAQHLQNIGVFGTEMSELSSSSNLERIATGISGVANVASSATLLGMGGGSKSNEGARTTAKI